MPPTGPPASSNTARIRRSMGASNAPTVSDLLSQPPDRSATVHSLETATVFLKKHGRMESSANSLTTEEVCNALLWSTTTKQGGAVQNDTIRSVVFLLMHGSQDPHIAEDIIASIEMRVEGAIAEAMERLDAMAEQVVERVKDAASTGSSDAHHSTHEHTPSALSYAAIASQKLPPQHTSVVEKGVMRRRQVVLECAALCEQKSTPGPPLSEKELVAKATVAFEHMGDVATADAPEGLSFRGARKLRNGMVAYDMDSPRSADWLKQPDVMKSFLSCFDGGQSKLKPSAYYVIAEFIPVAFQPTDSVALRRVEHNSGLTEYDILSGRWIKPANRRSSTQRVAHAILHMRSPETANHAIRNGLNIEGKTVSVRKLLQEPRRCLQCQKYTPAHLAANCAVKEEVCGTCAGPHRTVDCTVTSHMQRFCVNCNEKGHASWDRDCPAFVEAFDKLSARSPGNWYRFFPTADPRTWEMIDAPGHSAPHPSLRVASRGPSSPSPSPSPPTSQPSSAPLRTLGSAPARVLTNKPGRTAGAFVPPRSDSGWSGKQRQGRAKHSQQSSLDRWIDQDRNMLVTVAEEGEVPPEHHTEIDRLSHLSPFP
ncbi:hypothetical protein C8Q79DRAFT_1006517 [Trametes meyenii]|nr:hypothetical protein C8Q79DRAFT_1006517 [Trametes meyenii]